MHPLDTEFLRFEAELTWKTQWIYGSASPAHFGDAVAPARQED